MSASAVVPQLTAEWGLDASQRSWMTMSVQLGFVAGTLLSAVLNLAADRRAVTTVSPKTFPGWSEVPVVDELQRRMGIPVVLENNATAAAIGESRFGAGRMLHSFFYVFFGTGLGGGFIVEGHAYEGFTGNAGEIG